MNASRNLLAFDLGAESGRGILGSFDGNAVRLEVLHRFSNLPVRTLDRLHWDVLSLFREMLHTLNLCGSGGIHLDSLGVDTWGVDFGFIGRDGSLLGNPRHYRDPHTETIVDEVFAKVSREKLYNRTGLQMMRFNSLFQLAAMKRDNSPQLDMAEHILFMPDLFHYWFTGIRANEYTDTSTSQMLDPVRRTWDTELISGLGLPTKMLGTVIAPGTELGPLRTGLLGDTGLSQTRVVAPATHDTAAAVAAVPARGDSWAYISSGTWSLMGVEIPAPLVNDATRAANFTNEGGVNNTIRLLKNVMGLWLVQEIRRDFARKGSEYSYEALVLQAREAEPFRSIVDPDDASFILPSSMTHAFAQYCRKSGQPAPETPGAFVRCALESLALRYRWVLGKLEELTGKTIETIHIVGGGCQNALLNQFTADACQRQVLAGPVEATALGNIMTQAMGLRLVSDLTQAREVIRNSFGLTTFDPASADRAEWDKAWSKFQGLIG